VNREAEPSERWAPRFFTIWTGQALSLLGSNVAQFALVWWVIRTTGSATVLATATRALFFVAGVMQIAVGPGGFRIPLLMQLEDYPRRTAAADDPAMAAK